ncbi:transcription termination factor, mitochondrial-like isoform X1 [Cydia pomonella]|uniref:transcription termination factor, mitochondrial-like isoform X1 n=1 Tax=Cydia pomonella TaxID=82600 RepID=UPI002ADE3D4C|nr:transcription termination factor, mitochondrial-like isoform X1 [Cydia pomonella]
MRNLLNMRKFVSSFVLLRQINTLIGGSFHKISWLPRAKCENQLYNNLINDFTKLQFYNTTSKAEVITKNENNGNIKCSKEKLISQMNFLSEEHARPYYKLPMNTLLHIYQTTKNDSMNGFCNNRLYYIADKIKCSPSELSERLAKRTFVYTLSFQWLENSLRTLLEMGVSTDRILRDLWVLKYKHETIRERLQRVKDMGIETLYPWMVRCKQDIMNRYIKISQDTKNILGGNKSTQIYLADRLNTTPEAVAEICTRIPALKTIRVTKVKHFLDFLISEGFQPEDIANKPRVLVASPNTVKQRLEKLRKLGFTEINLNVLCKSRKDFKKYYESIEALWMENKLSKN